MAKASNQRASLSNPAANPTGLGKKSPATSTPLPLLRLRDNRLMQNDTPGTREAMVNKSIAA